MATGTKGIFRDAGEHPDGDDERGRMASDGERGLDTERGRVASDHERGSGNARGRATSADEGEKRRRSLGFDEAIEDAIQRGYRDGAFENLRGKGKPLRWETAQDDEWWLANHMLKSAGYTPEWIDRSKSLRAQIEQARGLLADFERWYEGRKASASAEDIHQARAVREKAFRDRVAQLNPAIDAYNVICPVASARLRRLDADDEVNRWKDRMSR